MVEPPAWVQAVHGTDDVVEDMVGEEERSFLFDASTPVPGEAGGCCPARGVCAVGGSAVIDGSCPVDSPSPSPSFAPPPLPPLMRARVLHLKLSRYPLHSTPQNKPPHVFSAVSMTLSRPNCCGCSTWQLKKWSAFARGRRRSSAKQLRRRHASNPRRNSTARRSLNVNAIKRVLSDCVVQLLQLHAARTKVVGQMRDADALQGKIDVMCTEVTKAANSRYEHKF